MLLVPTFQTDTTSRSYEKSFDLLAFILIKRNMSLYLCWKVDLVSIPGGIQFVVLPALLYVAFTAVLRQLLGESSCPAARKTLDTFYDC